MDRVLKWRTAIDLNSLIDLLRLKCDLREMIMGNNER